MTVASFTFPQVVQGWLNHEEGRLLFDLACEVPTSQEIVELGSYKGKSTICLAQSGHHVIAVDHYQGDGSVEPFDGADLIHNLEQWDLRRYVTLVEDWTDGPRAFEEAERPVGLLFVDADHSRAVDDYLAWSGRMAPDGALAFHDCEMPNVAAAIRLAEADGYRRCAASGALAVLRKGRP